LVDVAVIMKGTVLTTYEGFKNFGWLHPSPYCMIDSVALSHHFNIHQNHTQSSEKWKHHVPPERQKQYIILGHVKVRTATIWSTPNVIWELIQALHNLHFSQNIISVIRSKRMRWKRHAAHLLGGGAGLQKLMENLGT
jgi:hypothetical protein